MKKLLLATAFSIAALSTPAMAAGGKCGDVSVAEMNWPSGGILTQIAKFLMEQGYGCNVQVVPSSTVTAITSLAENNEPDVVIELWVNSTPAYPGLEAAGKVKKAANIFGSGGVENWLIPTYLAEKHPELTTIQGILDNPHLVGGRFHNCPDGWACKIISENLANAFDLEGSGIEVFTHGSGETLAAALASAVESREPWFGYYWSPTAILGKYDMTPVDIGDYDAEAHLCNTKVDCRNPRPSPWPPSPVLTVVTTDFADREPDVAALMSNMTVPNDALNKLLSFQEATGASYGEAAVFFLANNRDLWGSWLNDTAAKKLGFRR